MKHNRWKSYEMMSCYQGLLEYCEIVKKVGENSSTLQLETPTKLLQAAIMTAEDIVKEEINLAGGGVVRLTFTGHTDAGTYAMVPEISRSPGMTALPGRTAGVPLRARTSVTKPRRSATRSTGASLSKSSGFGMRSRTTASAREP